MATGPDVRRRDCIDGEVSNMHGRGIALRAVKAIRLTLRPNYPDKPQCARTVVEWNLGAVAGLNRAARRAYAQHGRNTVQIPVTRMHATAPRFDALGKGARLFGRACFAFDFPQSRLDFGCWLLIGYSTVG